MTFCSSSSALGWQNSTVLSADTVTAIERPKRTKDIPMRLHGSISLNHTLLAAGLVDRLEIIVFSAGRRSHAHSSWGKC